MTWRAAPSCKAVCLSNYEGEVEEAALKHPDCLQAGPGIDKDMGYRY